MFIHDTKSLCFFRSTDLSIHKQLKTQTSRVSATDSYGEKALPALHPAAFRATAVTSCANNLSTGDWDSDNVIICIK